MKKIALFLFIFLFLGMAFGASAHQPKIIYGTTGDVQVQSPEVSQAFYDELIGSPRFYIINSDKSFNLYLNLLVPELENKNGRYSANVFSVNGADEKNLFTLDAKSSVWPEYYEEFGRDYYSKGPEVEQELPAGTYKIEVFSETNTGKYVMAIGKTEAFDAQSVLNVYWQLPMLKMQFFKSSVLEFFYTPFGIAGVGAIGALAVIIAILNFITGAIKESIEHKRAKTLLLTSAGMAMKDEIVKLLQKPAYDITVAFISTAAKPEEDLEYLKKDWTIMKEEMGFNVQEIDIEGKKEAEVMKLLELKDIIFVEGGNTFYLLKAMRACNFGKIMKKLLKHGKVYIGVSAGSIVAGKTIKTADKFGTGNRERFGVKNLKGLGLVNFDIFPHYTPEHAEIIKKKLPWKWQRKKLKIITDEQAILVQGKDIALIGRGDAVVL